MIFRKLKLIRKLRAENYQLRKENVKREMEFVNRCDYNNLKHENMVLSSRRITYFEYISVLEKEKDEHLEIKEKYINLLASTKILKTQ